MANLVEVTVRANDDATKTSDAIRANLEDLGRVTAIPSVDLRGSDEAVGGIRLTADALSSLGRQKATPDVELKGGAETVAEAEAVSEAVKKVGSSGSSAEGSLGGLGTTMGGLSGMAMPALIGAGVVLSPVLLAVGTGMGGLGLAAEQTVSPILKAASATGGLQANMGTLTPVQQQMAQGLIGLQGQVGKFTTSLQPEVVSLWGAGLKLAGGILGDIEPVAKVTGDALSRLVGDIGADLKTAQWQQFFQFMAQNAGPDIQLLGQLFMNLMNDLPPLLEELQPLATGLLHVASGAAALVGQLDLINPSLSVTSVKSAEVQQNSGNMFTRFLADSKSVLSQVTGIGQSTSNAATGTAKMGSAAAVAAPQVGTLSGDVALLNASTTNATTSTKAFNDMWAIFVGKAAGDQGAVLAVKSAFDSYNAALKTSKGNSDAAQTAFLGIITAMGSGLSTLRTNGATIQQVNAFYQTNIDRLNTLHGLTPAERSDIQGVTRDYLAWANSSDGLNKSVQTASSTLKNDFLAQLGSIISRAPGVKQDVDNIATSILKTGTDSSATASDRQKLITDLENAGVSASNAKKLVDNLQGSINSLKGKNVPVGATASGSGKITATENILGEKSQTLGNLTFVAGGGQIKGGIPGRDSVLGMLMPDEVVVPAHMVHAGAVDHLRGKLPGFAAGGSVRTGALSAIPDWMGGQESSFVHSGWPVFGNDVSAVFMHDAQAAAARIAAANAAKTAASKAGSGISSAGVSNQSAVAALQSAAAKMGWTGAEWTALNNVEMREAGYSLTATNPSSGAYGLAQFINGPSEYAQYGGNSSTAAGQATAMVNYIKQRYGDPEAAWQHELNFGWYDHGGWLKPGYTVAYNGTGKPEPVGAAALGAQVVQLEIAGGGQSAFEEFILYTMRNLVRIKGGGNVQAAFGRN